MCRSTLLRPAILLHVLLDSVRLVDVILVECNALCRDAVLLRFAGDVVALPSTHSASHSGVSALLSNAATGQKLTTYSKRHQYIQKLTTSDAHFV